MKVSVFIPSSSTEALLEDMVTNIGGQVLSVDYIEDNQHEYLNETNIKAIVPLSKMLGYAARMRSIASGAGSFSMDFEEYQHKL
jgi:translation elongation factor EF-G